jgi:hypothetical protein
MSKKNEYQNSTCKENIRNSKWKRFIIIPTYYPNVPYSAFFKPFKVVKTPLISKPSSGI